jgi:hypothetical protein
MPKLTAYNQQNETANDRIELAIPTHVAGNLLLAIASLDANNGPFTMVTAGWTPGGENSQGATGNNTIRGAWWWKLATSSSEPAPLITVPIAEDLCGWIGVISGVNQTTPIDVSNGNGVATAAFPYTAAAVTTATANALVFFACCSDGGVSPCTYPGAMVVTSQDNGANGLGVSYRFQETAGDTGTQPFYCSGQADESVLFTIAVRDDGTANYVPGYQTPGEMTLVSPLKGINVALPGSSHDTNALAVSNWGGAVNPQYVYQVDVSVPTFTDITAAATNSTTNDVIPFPATEAVDDYCAVGYSAPFGAIRIDNNGGTLGVAGAIASEYWNGTAWKALPRQGGNALANVSLGTGNVRGWQVPADWVYGQPDANLPAAYWIRFRVTTIYTTNPKWTQIWVSTTCWRAMETPGCLSGMMPSKHHQHRDARSGEPLGTLGARLIFLPDFLLGQFVAQMPAIRST